MMPVTKRRSHIQMSGIAVAGIRPRAIAPLSVQAASQLQPCSAYVFHGMEADLIPLHEWQHLLDRQRGTTVFQSPDLLSIWSRHFTEGKDRLLTVVVRREGRAILIWPLLVERVGLVRIAKGAGAPIGQYDEVLLDPDADPAEALTTAIDALVRAAGPDLIFLERARADGALRNALGDVEPLASAEGAPFADLSHGSAHLMASLKSRVARQQRKRMRQFEQHGQRGFEVASEPEIAERWLSEAIVLKKEWLRRTGRFSRAFARHETTDCLLELARSRARPESSPRVLISRLTLDDRTAAIEMGLCHRGVYHLYLGAFAPEFAKLGPGNVLTEKLMCWCAENGIERFDMLAPRSRNKSEWQSGEVAVLDFAIPTTSLGRIYVGLVLRRLLPALRRTFYALPDSVRSTLAGFALRKFGAPQAHPPAARGT